MPVVLLSCRCLQCVDIGCLPVVARMALAAFMALSNSIAPTPCSGGRCTPILELTFVPTFCSGVPIKYPQSLGSTVDHLCSAAEAGHAAERRARGQGPGMSRMPCTEDSEGTSRMFAGC